MVFAGSWLPLNVFNIVADFEHGLVLALDRSGLIFAVCHLVALGSACANPVLYGWLNDNFRREFVAVLCRRCLPGAAATAAATRPPSPIPSERESHRTVGVGWRF